MAFPITSHYPPLQSSGPCNSFTGLGHFKNVYDDDDDDDEQVVVVVYLSIVLSGNPVLFVSVTIHLSHP